MHARQIPAPSYGTRAALLNLKLLLELEAAFMAIPSSQIDSENIAQATDSLHEVTLK